MHAILRMTGLSLTGKSACELDDTLEFVPEAEVAKELGRAYARQSKKEEAFAQFDEANELDPLVKLELAAEFTLQQGGESARLGGWTRRQNL